MNILFRQGRRQTPWPLSSRLEKASHIGPPEPLI